MEAPVRRLPSILLALPALVLVGSAHAQTTGGGSIGAGGIGSSVEVPGGTGANGSDNSAVGGSSSNGTGASSSSGGGSAPTTIWTRHVWGTPNDPGYANLNQPFSCPAGSTGYEDVQTSVATGEVLQRVQGCTAVASGGTPVPTTAPPPAPPTAAEARSIVPLPTPAFGISPDLGGLTGLEVRLWDASDTTPKVAVAVIRGYTVTSTARPVRWVWDMAETGPPSQSNPPSTITSTRPGSEAFPAGHYTYETKGEYAVTMTTTWSGSYVYAGNGVAPVTADLGTTTRTARRGYAVAEVRPVLVAR